MSDQVHHDHNLEGIFSHLEDYLNRRKQHVVRLNPFFASVIDEVVWTQTENLKIVLVKQKGFGAERIRVADVLAGEDELKRKSLFQFSDQNSILWEIINKQDEGKKSVAELPIHDQVTFFHAVNPALEGLVRLVQHWLYWDLPDAVDVLIFEDQIKRLNTLLNVQLSEDIRNRYRVAMRKRPDEPLTDADIFQAELKRTENAMNRFLIRRVEEEAFMKIVARDKNGEAGELGEPYDYKRAQAFKLKERFESEHHKIEEHLKNSAEHAIV